MSTSLICRIKELEDQISGGGDDNLLVCDDLPIADNDLVNIRAGSAGASEDAARCDHKHPIVRQANPGYPTFLAGGNMTLVQTLNSRFWSDEESVFFGQRLRVQQPAGNGWGWVAVPNIAGFQRPMFLEAFGYRVPSTAAQIDDASGNGLNGAAPRGPVMNNEISHWSFTQRLYGSYFRRDNDLDTYITLVLQYVRL